MLPSKVADTLIRYAKSREAAYRKASSLSSAKLSACTRICTVANFFSGKSEEIQIRAIRQIESELRFILPHEKSRYHKQRKTILDLIELSHD